MKQRKYVCYYLNSNYDERVKYFDDVKAGLEFTRLLDNRIEKGTCFGYDFTSINVYCEPKK